MYISSVSAGDSGVCGVLCGFEDSSILADLGAQRKGLWLPVCCV